MREDVEHVHGVAVGVAALLAGLAVDGSDDGRGGVRQGGQPAREGVAERLQGEFRHVAADRGGVRRLVSGEAQGTLEDPPMVVGPSLERGEIGLATEQTKEGQRQHRRERVTDAPWLTGVVDLAEGIEQRSDKSGHP